MVSAGRIISGYVVKLSGNKSISVSVEKRVLHPKYRKIIKKTRKYIVHDQDNICGLGDMVEAIECRPISKLKSFKVNKVIAKGVNK